MFACLSGDVPSVQRFVREAAASRRSILQVYEKQPDSSRLPLLESVSMCGKDEVLRELLQGVVPPKTPQSKQMRRACVNRQFAGATPLFEACRTGSVACATLLLEAGADVDLGHQDPGLRGENETPLHGACHEGRDGCVALLLTARADTRTTRAKTLNHGLYYAAKHGHDNVVRVLIAGGVDIDAALRDSTQTALYAACYSNHSNIVQMLLRAGANPRSGEDGDTPIACARRNHGTESECYKLCNAEAQRQVQVAVEAQQRQAAAQIDEQRQAEAEAQARRKAELEAEAEAQARRRAELGAEAEAQARRKAELEAEAEAKQAKRRQEDKEKKERQRSRLATRQRVCTAASLATWDLVMQALEVSEDLPQLREIAAALAKEQDDCTMDQVEMRGYIELAQKRIEKLEHVAAKVERVLLAEDCSLVRGDFFVANEEFAFNESRCPICMEDFATELRDAYVVLLPCRHPVCARCLCQHRVQCRKPASDELDLGFEEVEVPLRPVTKFRCPACVTHIADEAIEHLAGGVVQGSELLLELSRLLPSEIIDGQAYACHLVVQHGYDLAAVEEALFDTVVATAALGSKHAHRKRLYEEARAPVQALRRDRSECPPSQRGDLDERVRHAMLNASREVFATMNSQAKMGLTESGVARVDFHGLHENEVAHTFDEWVAPVAQAIPVEVIVGEGQHSSRQGCPVLRYELQMVAEARGFEIEEVRGALIIRAPREDDTDT